jgi:hypothetical protein
MDPTVEAAQILTRLLESICRLNRKTLNARSRADIARACELLSHSGEALSDLLDDLPPPRTEYSTVSFEVPPEVERWKERRASS